MELEFNTELDSEQKDKYRQDTSLEQRSTDIEKTFESGTIPITKELYKQAAHALNSRIENTSKYTQARIARINENYNLYYGQKISIISDLVDDWVDKLYKIFSDFGDKLKVDSEALDLDGYITQSLEIDEREDSPQKGRLRSLLNFFMQKEKKETDIYYFAKKEMVKTFLKRGIKKAEIKTKLEDFLEKGIISGLFCMKEGWGETKDFKIQVHDENNGSKKGKEYISQGNMAYTLDSEPIYTINIPDSRNLIFRKDSSEWVIERIPSNYWKLIEDSVDASGNPKENAIYDIKMLDRIKEYLKTNTDKAKLDNDKNLLLDFDMDYDNKKIYELEGDVMVYEGHHIPLVLDGKPKLCIIAAVMVNEKLVPIRIQETPFIRNNPYKMTNFLPKTNDIGGMGLPEKLEELSKEINNMDDLIYRLTKMSIYGITAGDKKYFKNPEKLRDLSPGDHIDMKNTQGRSIREVLEWFLPPTQNLPIAFDVMKFYIDFTTKLSRKGAGDKISPNPSATEASVIMDSQEEPINRVGKRLNLFFSCLSENMYFYTLLNRDGRFSLKLEGSKILDSKDADVNGKSISKSDKLIELTRDELLLEGVKFTVEAVEIEENKQAVQKQQYMQGVTLLYKTVGVTTQETDPITGQPKQVPKKFTDDVGNEVVLDEFKVVSDLLNFLNIDNPWRAAEKVVPPNPNPMPSNGEGGSQRTNVPNLQASPNAADIQKGVMQA